VTIVQPLLGLIIFFVMGYILSESRKNINWRQLIASLLLQVVLVLLILKTTSGIKAFLFVGKLFHKVQMAYDVGVTFVFGDFTKYPMLPPISLGLKILPMIIFVSAISAVLYHYRILQLVIKAFALLFRKVIGMSGVEALVVSANIFMGMAEAPVLVSPCIKNMTRAQLFMMMVGGMATISGSLMLAYAMQISSLLGGVSQASAHLLSASVISAPAAFLLARLFVPEMDVDTAGTTLQAPTTEGFFDALVQGALVGIKVVAYVAAILMVIVGLVNLFDQLLSYFFGAGVTLSYLLGILLKYPTWLLGICWEDCEKAGQLLGAKVILNEFIAYNTMGKMTFFDMQRTPLILSYAMCGFANLGSTGIVVASLSGLCPERRTEIANLGLKSMWVGFMAICMTGMVVAILF